jgi:phosphoribosylformylglycinamidine synthase
MTLVSSSDLCSKAWIYEQYDYMVRTNTMIGPGGDAAVVRIKETGQSVAMSLDGNGRYCYLDPREGAKLVVAEGCRNVSTSGALPVAATNNLNFGNPEKPEVMAQLVEAIEGMAEACEFFETPITGGNVSLYNETLGKPIYPTPVIGIVGLLESQEPMGIAFREEGCTLALIGGIGNCDEIRFGSSQYAKAVLDRLWGLPPALDMKLEKSVQEAIRDCISSKLIDSAHDLGEGGLAVALAECAFASQGLGADVDLNSDLRPELLLFHEGPSRILISTEDFSEVQAVCRKHGVEALRIGVTMSELLRIRNRNEQLINLETGAMREAWETALPGKMNRAQHVR